MAAVELKPEIIYLDHQLNSIDQYHLIHHLNKNSMTKNIPVFIHQNVFEQLTNQSTESLFPSSGSSIESPNPHQNIYFYNDGLETLENLIRTALLKKLL